MRCSVLVNWLSKVAYTAFLVGKKENSFPVTLLSHKMRSWLEKCSSVAGQMDMAVFKCS